MAISKRVLVADDSGVVRKVARVILEDLGFSVVEAENGLQAIDKCLVEMPQLLFFDWHMPGLTALEFVSRVRAMQGEKRPLIVYMPTENDPADIARILQAGADSYLMKPFDRAAIEEKLAEIQSALAIA